MTDATAVNGEAQGAPSPAPKKPGLVGDIVMLVIAVALVAGGVGALNTYMEERAETRALNEGVETEATVISVNEWRGVRGGYSTSLTVSYPGRELGDLIIADVSVCTETRYDDEDTVRVVHARDDLESVRLEECAATIDSTVPLAIGILLLLAGFGLTWSTIRARQRRKEVPATV